MVRNPFVRAASAFSFFNYVIRAKWAGEKAMANPRCQVKWKDFCWNPRVLERHCRLFPKCCGGENLNILMLHTDPQAPCTLGTDGKWAVDFVARAEHSDEDLPAVLQLINDRRPEGLPPLQANELQHANV